MGEGPSGQALAIADACRTFVARGGELICGQDMSATGACPLVAVVLAHNLDRQFKRNEICKRLKVNSAWIAGFVGEWDGRGQPAWVWGSDCDTVMKGEQCAREVRAILREEGML